MHLQESEITIPFEVPTEGARGCACGSRQCPSMLRCEWLQIYIGVIAVATVTMMASLCSPTVRVTFAVRLAYAERRASRKSKDDLAAAAHIQAEITTPTAVSGVDKV